MSKFISALFRTYVHERERSLEKLEQGKITPGREDKKEMSCFVKSSKYFREDESGLR